MTRWLDAMQDRGLRSPRHENEVRSEEGMEKEEKLVLYKGPMAAAELGSWAASSMCVRRLVCGVCRFFLPLRTRVQLHT